MSALWMPCLVYHEKNLAGISYGEPLHGELFFCNQTYVDQFVRQQTVQRAFSYKDMQNFAVLMKCMNGIISRFAVTFLLVAYASQC